MNNFNDFIKSKKDLLTDEIIEKIEIDYPLVIDVFKRKKFEIETANSKEKKNEILLFLQKGIDTLNNQLYSFYSKPNLKSITNGYDSSLVSIHFLNLYKYEYENLRIELSKENTGFNNTIVKKDYDKSIFKDEYTSLLFDYFEENYYNENKNKYVQIYRYLKDNLVCSQLTYRDYIKERFGVKLSKITTDNYNCQLILKHRENEFRKLYKTDLE